MTPRATLTLAALAILTVMPAASAHINNFADTKTIDVAGAYYVQIDPQPQPLYANQTTTFTVYVTSRTNGSYVTHFNNIHLTLEEDGTILDVPLEPTANETLVGTITFPHRGNYTTTLKLDDGTRHGENTTWMDVFHDYGYLVVPVDDFVDPIRNETTTFFVQTIDPLTRERKQVATDMRFKIEHWDNAHTKVQRTYYTDLMPQSDGTFKFEDTFTELGQYHLYVGSTSAGLDYGDVPMLHLFANDPIDDDDEKGIPFVAPLLALAIASAIVIFRKRP